MLSSKSFTACIMIFLLNTTVYSQEIEEIGGGGRDEGSREKRFGSGEFSVYWQVPTESCHAYGMNFSEVAGYGIVQNTGDRFRGDRIVIMYDPGSFPTLEPLVNGGLPQTADLQYHLKSFSSDLDKKIPDKNYDGLAIIDFEHWRPIFRENWSKMDVYRQKSRELIQRQHPTWPDKKINFEAERSWEAASIPFFRKTLDLARQLRPRAEWGFYAFPYCFNFNPNNPRMECTDAVIEDNDRSGWMWKGGNALFPSAYLSEKELTEKKRASLIRGRVEEGLRVASKGNGLPLYIYTRFQYQDTGNFITTTDMWNNLYVPKKNGADGVIIWGSSKDVNTRQKCVAVLDYLNNVIGPAMKKITNIRSLGPDVEANEI